VSRAHELFRKHHLAVFRFLRRMTGNQETAEDLLQDVFLRVVRAEPGFKPSGRDRAWLFRITRNVLLNHRRSRSRRSPEDAMEDRSIAATASPPLDRLTLEQALERLADVDRAAFLMREVGGLGYQEIAEATGLSPDAVRNRIYRARMELRGTLAGDSRRPAWRVIGE